MLLGGLGAIEGTLQVKGHDIVSPTGGPGVSALLWA
jgi:hypothetical protein